MNFFLTKSFLTEELSLAMNFFLTRSFFHEELFLAMDFFSDEGLSVRERLTQLPEPPGKMPGRTRKSCRKCTMKSVWMEFIWERLSLGWNGDVVKINLVPIPLRV